MLLIFQGCIEGQVLAQEGQKDLVAVNKRACLSVKQVWKLQTWQVMMGACERGTCSWPDPHPGLAHQQNSSSFSIAARNRRVSYLWKTSAVACLNTSAWPRMAVQLELQMQWKSSLGPFPACMVRSSPRIHCFLKVAGLAQYRQPHHQG